MKTIHDVRENFKLEDFLGAREKTLGALSEVQNRLEAGMNEAPYDSSRHSCAYACFSWD